MTVPTLPTAPTRTMAQDVFDPAMDAWIAALANWTVVVNAMGITTLTGSIQSTPIGNVTPSTGAFTTLSASGNIIANVRANLSHNVATGPFCAGNAYYSGGWKRIATGGASALLLGGDGAFVFYGSATSDAADTVIAGFDSSLMTLSPTTGLAVTGAISATTTIKTGGYTVATLPAGTTGDRAYVTDATAPTYLGALTGGGAVVCPVFKNATAWISA